MDDAIQIDVSGDYPFHVSLTHRMCKLYSKTFAWSLQITTVNDFIFGFAIVWH